MSELNEEIQSPCIGVCAMDDTTGLCHGCYRNLAEIQDWWDLDNVQKKKVVEEASKREAAVFDT
jgi:predicted Fe-S protein YdhL (DUF1289 family)